MTSQILVRIDSELKEKIQRLSHFEKKSVNEKIRELVAEYVKEHDMEASMKALWDEAGRDLKKRGHKASDVRRMIKEARSAK